MNRRKSSVAASAQCRSSSTTTQTRSGRASSSSRTRKSQSRDSSSRVTRPPSADVCAAISCTGASARGVDSASHAPQSVRTSRRCSDTNRSTSELLPSPASPATNTSLPEAARASWMHRFSVSSCSWRSSRCMADPLSDTTDGGSHAVRRQPVLGCSGRGNGGRLRQFGGSPPIRARLHGPIVRGVRRLHDGAPGDDAMPRYVVEREFPDGLQIPVDETGAKVILAVVEGNAVEQVAWLHSYVSADKKKTFCVYDGPSPEAIRRTATRNKLPVQRITEVRVLDPYFYK